MDRAWSSSSGAESVSEALALPLRLTGAVSGHLVGDAMGVPYEFLAADQVGEVRWGREGNIHHEPPGTWSDDGALMLALMDSLLDVGFETEDQGRRALAWRREGAYAPGAKVFDIGTATRQALDALAGGTPAEQAGPTHERSQSNGSLMRILPLALWAHAQHIEPGALADLATRASSVTHGHPVPRIACAVYTLIASALLNGVDPARALEKAINTVRARYTADGEAPDAALAVALDEFVDWPRSHQPEGRGGALNGFWSAWTAFEGAASYQETIERAIRYGNDTDTTAAIAAGLAGIRWGLDGIPAEWLAGMRGREITEPLIDRLLVANGWRTSTSHPIRVDWVDLTKVPNLASVPGRLGMTFLPGKQYVSDWSGEWWRDLERDVARLRDDHGCDVFLLLVEDHELDWTRTTALATAFERHGMELRRHPVVDMNIPTDRVAYRAALNDVTVALRAGKSVVVACRGGLGRTGTAVACLLVAAGMAPDDAIALTRASRRNTIERGTQVAFVEAWPVTEGKHG
jgi:ADP-ribosylglycohydrolase/protein-tyrosine phosphatase